MATLLIQAFLKEFFTDPILNDTGYNPVNTVTYLIILIITVFYLRKKLFKNTKMLVSTFLPLTIFIPLLRVTFDKLLYLDGLNESTNYQLLLKSPGFFAVTLIITLFVLHFSKVAKKYYND